MLLLMLRHNHPSSSSPHPAAPIIPSILFTTLLALILSTNHPFSPSRVHAQAIISIGVILPTDTPITDVSARRVLSLTESDINQDPLYAIPNARYRLTFANSNSSKATAVEQAVAFATSVDPLLPPVVGIVGEYTSDNSGPMALALNGFKVYQCGIASSPDFSDKSVYKYFFRTVPSDQYQGYALATVVASNGWNKVGVITVNSPYGFGISSSFLSRASALNITILRNEAYNPNDANFRLQLNSLRESDARIIILIAFDYDVIKILQEARRQNMISPNHVWIGSDGVETIYSILHGSDSSANYSDQDRENIEGMVFTAPYEGGGGGEKALLDQRYAASFGVGARILSYSYFYRDCLLTMALGVKRLVGSGVPLERVLSRTTNVSVVEFVSQPFLGASGNVVYDSNADRVM
ncbi:hypothetical protein HDU67_000961 [Dinochytrium kinnereticum]|nr:hypothetical protein HDU67_000961 [Dinochytrium kinnereticum]